MAEKLGQRTFLTIDGAGNVGLPVSNGDYGDDMARQIDLEIDSYWKVGDGSS